MKCELCSAEFDKLAECKICLTRFCSDCGDYSRVLCNDCIEFNDASDGDIDDLSE